MPDPAPVDNTGANCPDLVARVGFIDRTPTWRVPVSFGIGPDSRAGGLCLARRMHQDVNRLIRIAVFLKLRYLAAPFRAFSSPYSSFLVRLDLTS